MKGFGKPVFSPIPQMACVWGNMVWTCIWDGMSKTLRPCVCVSAWFRMAWVTWWWCRSEPEDAWVAFFRTEEMAAAVAWSQSRIRRDLEKNKKKKKIQASGHPFFTALNNIQMWFIMYHSTQSQICFNPICPGKKTNYRKMLESRTKSTPPRQNKNPLIKPLQHAVLPLNNNFFNLFTWIHERQKLNTCPIIC